MFPLSTVLIMSEVYGVEWGIVISSCEIVALRKIRWQTRRATIQIELEIVYFNCARKRAGGSVFISLFSNIISPKEWYIKKILQTVVS
jgi:hypothetical protein